MKEKPIAPIKLIERSKGMNMTQIAEKQLKIAIVEDDPTIRTELALLLTNAGYQTAEVTDFEDTVSKLLAIAPDLVLLDVKLPGRDGLSVCDGLRAKSQVPVIFLTSCNTSMDELNCMLRGGDDYIAKPYQAPILLARIAAVLKRSGEKKDGTPVCLEHRGVVLNLASARIARTGADSKEEELTKNELKIMYYLFQHAGEIVARMDLIDYLWDHEAFMDDNALSIHITRLRGKLSRLGVDNFIDTKRGLGYRI